MSNIEFETDQEISSQFKSRTVLGRPQVPGMAAWLMKKGIIKDESQAGGVLVGIVLFNIVVTIVVIYFFVL